MDLNRRHLLTAAATGAAAIGAPANAAPLSASGLDAARFGVRPGAAGDQSGALQRAIDQAAKGRVPLMLAPGVYRVGGLTLPSGASLAGIRGATRLMLTQGPSLLSAAHADTVSLTGLTLDGGGRTLPAGRALVHFDDVKAVRLSDCQVAGAGGNAITLINCDGEVTHCTITGAADNALFCNDGRGLVITANSIAKSGNGGIRIWQSGKRHDGSLVADNTIEDTQRAPAAPGRTATPSIFSAPPM